MIQSYVHIYDLKPTEPLFDVMEDNRSPDSIEVWTKEGLEESIREHGVKYMIHCDSEGNIINGNARYWVCRKLFLEGDMRFEYMAVELAEMSGKFVINFEEQPDVPIAAKVFQRVLATKYTIIPNATGFQEYAIDSKNERQLDRFKFVMNRRWNTYPLKTKKSWAVLYKRRVRKIQGIEGDLDFENIPKEGLKIE
ncbi:hypothetical protein LCGC14_2155410 [marine sediment metagenome]|uniref:Uncharacterized protein n=1 Tax=marine sediment metagenome TaxID=412755 RepID=A0A0F9DUI3_9ZZZZ